MTDTLRSMSTRQHAQTDRADARQERNAAGGFTFVVDDLTRLRRFLATGVEGGTFYVGAKDVAVEAVASIERLVAAGRGVEAVETILDMSERGATMRQQSTMFVLAYLTGATDEATRTAALRALPRVCRTASHLFLFASYVEQFRGWGRALRRAVAQWYLDKPLDRVAYQGAKFRSRYGFTHRDLLRLSHPKPRRGALALDVTLTNLDDADLRHLSDEARAEFAQARLRLHRARTAAQAGRFEDALNHLADAESRGFGDTESLRSALADDVSRSALLALLAKRPDVALGDLPVTSIVAETLAAAQSPAETVEVLGEVESASWEMVQSEHLGKSEVWEALLDGGHVPIGALIRNLGRLTANGTLDPFGQDDRTARIIGRLRDQRVLTEGRVHPMSVMLAGATYATGHGDKGSLTWSPISNINKALDAGFYAAFGSIEPDPSKTVMLAVDVSGSMNNRIAGLPLTARSAASALAQCLAAQFPRNLGVVFTGADYRRDYLGRIHEGTNAVLPYDFDPGRRLTDIVRETSEMEFGRTDCALPMLHALERGLAIDTFVVLTDNETWAGGQVHPHQALRLYRERTGIDARMVTVAVQHNYSTIADPADPRMLDVIGLDPNVIGLVGDFVAGRV